MVVEQTRRNRIGRWGAWAGISLWVVVWAGGCGGSSEASPGPSRLLTADDFIAGDGGHGAGGAPIPVYEPERPVAERVKIRSVTEAEARGEIGDIGVAVGEPRLGEGPTDSPAPVAAEPGDLELVDANVGDLNGRPIQASVWLESRGARLKAESVGKSRAEWRAFAFKEIKLALVDDLTNELFLAEARAALTPEEKAGLRTFMRRFERDVVRSHYGSQTLADTQLRESMNMSLEQATRDRERALLINEQLNKVWDRVQVSSRDLRLEYERNFEKYNPPPEAHFRLIRVSSSDAAALAAITELLATTPFPEVADSELNESSDPIVVQVPEGLENTEMFTLPELQEAAAKLTPGTFAGPIETRGQTRWVYLDRIESTASSLYDVQLELRNEITAARREEEAERYLYRLFDRAGIRGIDDLTARLVDVAEAWYYEPEAR